MTTKAPVFHDPLPPLQMLLRQDCWGIAAGAGTGALVSLHFGRKLPRPSPLENPSLRPDLRTHQGEAILFIECNWSISAKGKTLFDTDTDDDANGRMTKALEQLRGASVSQITATMPPRDVSLAFDNGHLLKLHANEAGPKADPDDAGDNFTLSLGDTSFVIGADLGLRIEPRQRVMPILGHALSPRSAPRRKRPPPTPKKTLRRA